MGALDRGAEKGRPHRSDSPNENSDLAFLTDRPKIRGVAIRYGKDYVNPICGGENEIRPEIRVPPPQFRIRQ